MLLGLTSASCCKRSITRCTLIRICGDGERNTIGATTTFRFVPVFAREPRARVIRHLKDLGVRELSLPRSVIFKHIGSQGSCCTRRPGAARHNSACALNGAITSPTNQQAAPIQHDQHHADDTHEEPEAMPAPITPAQKEQDIGPPGP